MARRTTTILSDYTVLAVNNFCNYHTSAKAPDHFKCLCQEHDSVSNTHQPPIGSSTEWPHGHSSPEGQAGCTATDSTTAKDGASVYPLNAQTTGIFFL